MTLPEHIAKAILGQYTIRKTGTWDWTTATELAAVIAAAIAEHQQAEHQLYRILDPKHDTIHAGDEFFGSINGWVSSDPVCIGMKPIYGRYRRKIMDPHQDQKGASTKP